MTSNGNPYGKLINSYSTSTVTATNASIGGLICHVRETEITYSYYAGVITNSGNGLFVIKGIQLVKLVIHIEIKD